MAADLSSCTVHPDFTSLLILSFLCSTSTEGADIEMKVSDFERIVVKYFMVFITPYR